MHNRQAKQYLEFLKLSGIQDIYVLNDKQSSKDSKDLDFLAGKYADCVKCSLHKNRIKLVYGEGNNNAELMIISEGPGQEENLSGKPFVGAAGNLLTKMLNAINIEREDIYITNVVKCCPPGNRDPHPEEILACQNYLLEQIAIIKPKILLILGKVAAESILKLGLSLTAYREKTYLFQGIKTYVSYHPAALLRNVSWKRYAWTDLQKLQKDYEKLLNKEN